MGAVPVGASKKVSMDCYKTLVIPGVAKKMAKFEASPHFIENLLADRHFVDQKYKKRLADQLTFDQSAGIHLSR
jgi:hypothetical protein